MIDFSKLAALQYWIDPTPGVDFAFLLPLTILLVVILLTGILLSLVPTFRRYFWADAIGQWLRWFASLGILLTFFRYQNLVYLSMRLWYPILVFGFLIWLVMIVRSLRAVPTKLKEQAIRQETYDKYLPRPKQKRRKV